jgi:hypothetical protein
MKTDVELQQEVIRNLRSEIYLAGSKITVYVLRGTVRLHGQVSAHFKQLMALKAVKRVEGIRNIEDHLIVLRSSKPYTICITNNHKEARQPFQYPVLPLTGKSPLITRPPDRIVQIIRLQNNHEMAVDEDAHR